MTNDRMLFLGNVDPALPGLDQNPLVRPMDGAPVAVWNYGNNGAPHMRIIGSTGGSKSSLVRMIGRGLVNKPGARAITFIDAEGAGEFTIFEGQPGVDEVINVNPAADADLPEGETSSVQLAADAIAGTLAIALERAGERLAAQRAWLRVLTDNGQQPAYQRPGEVWLIIDGFGTLRYDLNRYLPKAKLDPVDDGVQIGKNGRKTDVHLIIADQVMYASRSKDDDGMPSRLKKQLNCSVAAVGQLGLTDSEGQMAFDDPHAGDKIPAVPGGCMMKIGATWVPFVTPYWLNATDPDADVTPDERRAAFRLLLPGSSA